MKFLPLVWRNLLAQEDPDDLHAAVDLRRLPAVRHADDDPDGVHVGRRASPALDRLVLIHKVSLIMPLPVLVLRSGCRRRRASSW